MIPTAQPAGTPSTASLTNQVEAQRGRPMLLLLWAVGGISFAAIVLTFTPYTYQLDDIKVTIQFVMAPIIGILLAIVVSLGHGQPIHPWIALSLMAYFLLGLLSTVLADFQWLAWQELGFELAAMIGFATVAWTASTRERFRNFCRFYYAIGCATIVFGLFHYLGGFALMHKVFYPQGWQGEGLPSAFYVLVFTLRRTQEMFSTILNRDFYPAYLLMIAPLTVALFSDSQRTIGRLFYLAAGFLCCLCIYLSKSNDSYVALVVAGIVLAAVGIRRQSWVCLPSKLIATWAVGFLILLVTGLFLVRSTLSSLPSRISFAARSRSILWSGAWGVFFDPALPTAAFLRRVIVGSAPGGYLEFFPRYRSPDYHRWGIAPITQFAHSQPLDLLSERGLLGTAAFASFLGGVVWLLFRQVRGRHDHPLHLYQAALLSSIVAITVQNLTSPNIRWTVCAFNYWFLLGLGVAVRLPLDLSERGLWRAQTSASSDFGELDRTRRAWVLPPTLRWLTIGSLLVGMIVLATFSAPYGFRRFVSSVYNNKGRVELSSMTAVINKMDSLPVGQERESLRQTALGYASRAVSYFNRSLDWLPFFLSSYYQLGYVYAKQAELTIAPVEVLRFDEQAIKTYDRLASLAPEYAEIDSVRGAVYGHLYLQHKQLETKKHALYHLERAARMTTALRPNLVYLRTLLTMDEIERAIEAFGRMLDLARLYPIDPGSHKAIRELFAQLLDKVRTSGTRDQTVTLCRRWLDYEPDDPVAFVALCTILPSAGLHPASTGVSEVLKRCQQWIERNPFDLLPRNVAANVLTDIHAYRHALVQTEALLHIQGCRGSRGPAEQSVKDSRTLDLWLDPRQDELWFRAGQLLTWLNDTSQALTCLENSIKAAPDERSAEPARLAIQSLRAGKTAPMKR